MSRAGLATRPREGKRDQRDRQLWATPQAFVAGVEVLTRRRIKLDVAAEAWSAKAQRWLGPGSPLAEDCLAPDVSWRENAEDGDAWLNPPFASVGAFTGRALTEAEAGVVTWAVVPPRTERPWWCELCRGRPGAPAYMTFLEADPPAPRIAGVPRKHSIDRLAFEPPAGIKASSVPGAVVLWQIGGPEPLLPLTLRLRTVLEAGAAELARRAA